MSLNPRCLIILVATLLLGGCGSTDVKLFSAPLASTYKQIVADSITPVLLAPPPDVSRDSPVSGVIPVTGPLEVSEARPALLASQPGDWIVCVKRPGAVTTYYAVFLIAEKVSDYRSAVIVDHCERETYSPLPHPRKLKERSASFGTKTDSR
jgi:hypothetical protein